MASWWLNNSGVNVLGLDGSIPRLEDSYILDFISRYNTARRDFQIFLDTEAGPEEKARLQSIVDNNPFIHERLEVEPEVLTSISALRSARSGIRVWRNGQWI